MYLCDLKDNLSDLQANAQRAFSLPRCEQDSFFEDREGRSGELWVRELDTRPATPELSNNFPAATQLVRCIRTAINKATGAMRFKPRMRSPARTQLLPNSMRGGEGTGT